MLKIIKAVLNKMNSKKDKTTLSQKLTKGERIVKPRNVAKVSGDAIPDIEDVVQHANVKSKYFSPVQTRHQRKFSANPPKKLLLTEKKSKTPKDEDDDDEVQPLTIEKIKKAKAGHKKVEMQKQVLKKEEPQLKQAINEEACTSFKNKLDVKIGAINAACTSVATKQDDTNWKPPHWLQMLQNVRAMRTASLAPVDFMGCDKCADDEADEKTQRFHKLVSLMLSSQTKDETTYEAMQRLKEHTLTPNSIVVMQLTDLEKILNPVSFYKTKAKHLQQTSRILIDKYAQDIPNNVKELIALPGVGPKMAHICMATAWNEITGIGVDVHVHRITNRMGWLPSETKKPESTRIALEQWLPRELWAEVNHLLVGFGQTICTPMQPKCGNCLNSSICPSAFKSSPSKASMSKNVGNKTKNAVVQEGTTSKKANLKKLKMHV